MTIQVRIPTWILATVFLCVCLSNASAKPVAENQEPGDEDPVSVDNIYYPVPPQERLRVTDEDYQDKYRSLAHLRGAYFNLKNVENFARKHKSDLGIDLQAEIQRILDEVGFEMLSETEVALEPGQPQFDIWPSFKPACCSLGFWANLSQGGKILADPRHNYRMGTWGDGANFLTEEAAECPHLGSWIAIEVIKKIEMFATDYKKARAELAQQKLEGTAPPPLPEVDYPECNTALMMYVEIFETGSYIIGRQQRTILDDLASNMRRCKHYRYLIETHADQRGSAEFNLQLTNKRAQTLSAYLLVKGVERTRFETRFYGESKPVSDGDTAVDYTANRRVVVTPFKIK